MKTTDGRDIIYYDYCPYCNLDTGGKHQVNCPMFNKPKIVVQTKV